MSRMYTRYIRSEYGEARWIQPEKIGFTFVSIYYLTAVYIT